MSDPRDVVREAILAQKKLAAREQQRIERLRTAPSSGAELAEAEAALAGALEEIAALEKLLRKTPPAGPALPDTRAADLALENARRGIEALAAEAGPPPAAPDPRAELEALKSALAAKKRTL